eukprot:3859837-Pleurochrysis_carterae.AAC.6
MAGARCLARCPLYQVSCVTDRLVERPNLTEIVSRRSRTQLGAPAALMDTAKTAVTRSQVYDNLRSRDKGAA